MLAVPSKNYIMIKIINGEASTNSTNPISCQSFGDYIVATPFLVKVWVGRYIKISKIRPTDSSIYVQVCGLNLDTQCTAIAELD